VGRTIVGATPEKEAPTEVPEEAEETAKALIWGTTVNVEDVMDDFCRFLRTYAPRRDAGKAHQDPYYVRGLKAAHANGTALDVNCRHLHAHSADLYRNLVQYPQEVVPIMDLVATEELSRVVLETALDTNAESLVQEPPRIQCRPYNLREVHDLRDLDPENIDQLVAVAGMVTRTSSVVPDLKQAHYRCVVCGGSVDVLVDRGRVDEPSKCARPGCGAKGAMELIHNRCLFTDRQIVRLQESPSQIPEGETPTTTTLFAFDDVVDAVRPGDRVEVTGIFRAIPRRVHPRVRTCKALFRTYIDAIHFRKKGDERDDVADVIDDDPSKPTGPQFSSDRIRQIERFARDGEPAYEKLVKALAPTIYGMEDVKRGVLCMLMGGCARLREARKEDGPRDGAVARTGTTPGARTRGDINILMCGDPGTAKSQLLSYVHKIAPRGVYTSGKGSSAVGLTASVQRDPETRELVLESGAVVLSDLGICCIDEFDKMSDMTRAVLHEAMEQQTISMAKAGIVATLNARASIFAAANPVDSRYNPRLSVVENIQLPPTLLSRFDLIYLILDNPDRDADRRMAQHIVKLYLPPADRPAEPEEKPVDERFLRDYVAFARARIHPELGPEARTELVEAYVRMRGGGSGRPNRGRAITATPRQLEGMIRIAEALTRMRLETNVTKADVSEAVRLMQVATLAAATDASTGLIDMDAITTGRTASDRALHDSLCKDLRKAMESRPRGVAVSIAELRDEIQRANDETLDQLAFLAALRSLAAEDALMYNERAATVVRR